MITRRVVAFVSRRETNRAVAEFLQKTGNPPARKRARSKSPGAPPRGQGSILGHVSAPWTKEDTARTNRALVAWLAATGRPFAITNDIGFLELLNTCRRMFKGYSLPCEATLRKRADALASQLHGILAHLLTSMDSVQSVYLTCDGYTGIGLKG